jgi:hypothetical protein
MNARIHMGLLAAAVALLGAACSGGTSASPEPQAAHAAKPHVAAAAGSALSPDMVSAVPGGKREGAPVLKFEIKQRPEVGKPVDVDLAFVPEADTESIDVLFRGGEGLEVQGGEGLPRTEKPEAGVPVHYTLHVTAKRDGLFAISAVVLTDTPAGSISHTYAIPVLAGTGAPGA